MSKSLDEILGERVFKALMKTGNYSREGIEKHIMRKFATGSLKEEDWRLFVELEIMGGKDEQKNRTTDNQ